MAIGFSNHSSNVGNRMFSKVVFDKSVNANIAQVNRQTGVLFINPQVWQRLTGDEREFVLLHEQGHLELQTASEYLANRYAVGKYLAVKTLSNAELGKRIQVVSEITHPNRYLSGFGGIDPISNIAAAVGSIFESLPLMGIGSKSRLKEADNLAENQVSVIGAQSAMQLKLAKSQQTMLIMAGAILIVAISVFFLLKSKK